MEKCPNLFKHWRTFLEEDIKEYISPETVDVSSFEIHDELSPVIWDTDQKLKPEVIKKLVEIAKDFFDGHGIEWVRILDITLTGSLANYNWSKYSDVDLHVIVDYNEVDENLELVEELLKAKRINWNKTHQITIYGFEVETYIQNINEKHESTGVYSLLRNEWNITPIRETPMFNWSNIKIKSAGLMDLIDNVGDDYKAGNYEEAIKSTDRLKEKIRKLRKCGLETVGAFSVENLAFKVLRRNGYLNRLNNYKILSYDKKMSLTEEI